jgi:hypothetical protein
LNYSLGSVFGRFSTVGGYERNRPRANRGPALRRLRVQLQQLPHGVRKMGQGGLRETIFACTLQVADLVHTDLGLEALDA